MKKEHTDVGKRDVPATRRSLWELFWVFFKIGLFTFGGGYAMLSMFEHEITEKRGWLDEEELSGLFGIAESTPGPIAINCATYIGYARGKAFGSFLATLGVVLPAFIIMFVISLILEKFMTFTIVANAFRGIQVAVAFLILRAGLRLTKKVKRHAFEIIAYAVTFVGLICINLFSVSFSTIWFIVAGAVCGILLYHASYGGKGEKA